LLLGPRPSSRSLRAWPSAAGFRSSSTLDDYRTDEFLAKWPGKTIVREPVDTKVLVAALPVCWGVASPIILDWNCGEPATLLGQACAATRKILIGQTTGSIC